MVMDSSARLDYALFQLTPTRTRCDLVIFAGKKNEKIASGLLEPFLSHLKSAKDEISKGGYSITLKPPSDNSPWFTKATLERFVRFVSTPEVLERFVTIEREIDQIERSNEQLDAPQGSSSDGDPKYPVGQSKSKYESNGTGDAEAEENHKMRLQRVLESRRAMLKKEQAMAYARSLVAGFEMESIHDLVSFGDAFGALRLREACINFMELCNKKNDDKIWMDEVAAMQASYLGVPGIILTGANNDLSQTGLAKSSTSDSITRHGSLDTSEGTENALPVEFNPQQTEGPAQIPAWPHYLPHYSNNAQGPVFQQMPPYPGYLFPGMSVGPPHYPGNVPWPANFRDSGGYADRDIKDSHRYKSSNKKREKPTNHAQPHSTSNGESIESDATSSQSDSGNEQEHEPSHFSREDTYSKKLRRRSSKKVVIRNINYITSGRNEDSSSASDSGSSSEDGYVDAGSLKQQVEAAVGSFKKHQKPSSNKNRGRDGSKKGSNKAKADLDSENAGTTNYADERKDGNWDIFQDLLMRDADSVSTDKNMQVDEEYSVPKGIGEETLSSRKFDRPKYESDDLILTERSTGNGFEKVDIKFEGEKNFHGVMSSSKNEALLIQSRAQGEYYMQNAHFGTESSILKSRKEEDWIMGSEREISASSGGGTNHNIFRGDQLSTNSFQSGENRRDVLLDDSFMVQSRLSDGPSQNHPKADIFVDSDIVVANECRGSAPGNMQRKVEAINYNEPEDLYMMLRSDSAPEPAVATWNSEMDYEKDVLLAETAASLRKENHKDTIETALPRAGNKSNMRNSKKPGAEVDRKAPKPKASSGYLGRSKSDIPTRTKMPNAGSATARGRAAKEEDKRKKTEELLLQRQKRIAERSASKGITIGTTRNSSKDSKNNSISAKVEKAKLQSPADENKMSRKPVIRSSTINRLAAPRTASKQLPTESKASPNRKPTSKGNSAMATPSMKKTKGTPEKQDKVNSSHKNIKKDDSSGIRGNVRVDTVPSRSEDSGNGEGALGKNAIEDFGAVKVLHAITSVEKRETNVISPQVVSDDKTSVRISSSVEKRETNVISPQVVSDDKKSVQISSDKELLLLEDLPKQAAMPLTDADLAGVMPRMKAYPADGNNLKSANTNINEKGDERKKISFSPQISVMDISTPPPVDNETSPELNHSRKKWNNGEGSPKIPKGFRKLLLFGRRS